MSAERSGAQASRAPCLYCACSHYLDMSAGSLGDLFLCDFTQDEEGVRVFHVRLDGEQLTSIDRPIPVAPWECTHERVQHYQFTNTVSRPV